MTKHSEIGLLTKTESSMHAILTIINYIKHTAVTMINIYLWIWMPKVNLNRAYEIMIHCMKEY